MQFAGEVESSNHPEWKPADAVALNGWGAGEMHWGGLAQQARVQGNWLMPLPRAFTARLAAAIGTTDLMAMSRIPSIILVPKLLL